MLLHLAGDLLFALDAVFKLDRRTRYHHRFQFGVLLLRQQGNAFLLRGGERLARNLHIAVVSSVCPGGFLDRRLLNGNVLNGGVLDRRFLSGSLFSRRLFDGCFLRGKLFDRQLQSRSFFDRSFFDGGRLCGRFFGGELVNSILCGVRFLLLGHNGEHHAFVFCQLALIFMENLTG